MGLVLLTVGWMTIGRWADQRHMGFVKLIPLPADVGSISERSGRFTVSRSHASIGFSGSMRRLQAGDLSTRTFRLSSNFPSEDHRLGFFVSGDQRARPLPLLKADFVLWEDMPVEYSVQVNQKVVATGRIEELSRAFFIEIPWDLLSFPENKAAEDVQVALTLRCLSACEIPAIPPALAVEYPFYFTGPVSNSSESAESGAGPLIRTYKHTTPAADQEGQVPEQLNAVPASRTEAHETDGGTH